MPRQRKATASLYSLTHERARKARNAFEGALSYERKGEADRAIESLRQAVTIDPEYMQAWNNQRVQLLRTNHTAEAIDAQDYNFDSVAGDRPDLAKPITYTTGSRDQKAAQYFDKTAFAAPASRTTFGTLPRTAVVGPATWNSNLSLLKKVQLTESKYVQLRGEAYNFLNHNNLNNPNTAMNSSDFGRILSRSGNRVIQLGARFVF